MYHGARPEQELASCSVTASPSRRAQGALDRSGRHARAALSRHGPSAAPPPRQSTRLPALARGETPLHEHAVLGIIGLGPSRVRDIACPDCDVAPASGAVPHVDEAVTRLRRAEALMVEGTKIGPSSVRVRECGGQVTCTGCFEGIWSLPQCDWNAQHESRFPTPLHVISNNSLLSIRLTMQYQR